MAIQGNSYTITTFSYEERPVPSAKLNEWDDQIESALELAYVLVNESWGGADGVVRGATANDLKITTTSPVSMELNVEAGYALIDSMPFKVASQMSLPEFSAPATNPRIDTVQAKLPGWAVEVKLGTEAASPTAPAVDSDAIVLAEIYLRPGMSSIKVSDDATNGYITDLRSFV